MSSFALLRGGRLGLRGRVTLAFGLMALALSVFLASVTWVLVTRYLLHQRETSAVVEYADNAAALRDGLQAGLPVHRLLASLPQSSKEASVLSLHGHWYSTLPPEDSRALPPTIVQKVGQGSQVERRLTFDGAPYLAVGAPLDGGTGRYFELFSMGDVDRTFDVLTAALVAGALATSLLGLAVGRFASRRALRPLTKVREAAAAVAQGDLSARLDAEFDPDLGGIARSFNQTTDALRRRVQADARFAGDVSHELRTPMTTMLNSVELIQNRRDELPPQVVEPLDMLTVELDRFRRLVVDLLEISRVDGIDGGGEHPKEPVTAADLVQQAADRSAGRPVTTVIGSASGVVILADKRRLERVVANLVDNAETHGRGCVGVVVDSTDQDVTIAVEDAGPGVPADRRDRVFERFARGPTQEPGVGLGLAIVARHVTWHGGRVRVEDRPGGGSRFVVALPRLMP